MHLLIISTMNGHAWGGSEELWFQTAKKALESNNKVTVCRYFYNKVEHHNVLTLRDLGCNIVYASKDKDNSEYTFIEPKRFYKRYWEKFVNLFTSNHKNEAQQDVLESLYLYNPDVILLSVGHTYEIGSDIRIVNLIERISKPYVILSQYHEEYGAIWSDKDLVLRMLAGSDAIFFVSKRNKDVVERQLAKKLDNWKVISNPVNLKRKEIIPYPNDSLIRFANVARLDIVVKGQDILLEILSQPTWEKRNWELNFYGSGHDNEQLNTLIDFYGLSNRVKLHGQVKDISSVWEANHILLFPSHGEGTPLSLMEAMICGRTVVGTDVGGISDCIIEDETGFLADWGSVRSFGRAMEKAWTNQDRWEEMGKRAHQHLLQNFDMMPEQTLYNHLKELLP